MVNKFENLLGKLDAISQPSSSNNSATKLLFDELKEYAKQQQQSTSGQPHEQCNKLIEELKSDKSKLEKKVEDCIKEKDDLADRFKRKEDYWSSLYMKMFTAAETNEGLAALFRAEGAQMRSQLTSVVPSPNISISCSQDGSASLQVETDNEDTQMQINTNEEEENKASDVATVCRLCGIMVSGPALKWNGIEVIGALMIHLNSDCCYVNKYTARVNEAASQWRKYLEGEKLKPYRDIRSFFRSCNEFLTVASSKVGNLPEMKGQRKKDVHDTTEEQGKLDQFGVDLIQLKQDLLFSVSQFQTMLSPFATTTTFYSCQKADKAPQVNSYYLIDRELELSATGRCSMLNRGEEGQNETYVLNKESNQQQQQLSDLTRYWCSPCQRIFGCRDLWQQHCNANCNYSDVFFDSKYDHSFGSGLLSLSDTIISSNGLTKRKINKTEIKIVKEEIKLLNSQLKTDKAVQRKLGAEQKRTPLEQRRVDQEITIKELFKIYKSDLLVVEDWLSQLASHFKRIDPYTKVGLPICDAIILKKCPLLFGKENHNINMKAYFQSHGVPVAVITDARRKGFIFLGLDDAKNQFNNDLIQKLKATLDDMVFKVKEKNGNWREIFIYQVDYAQDLLGFFMSTNVMADLKEFSTQLGMPYSRTLDQLATCFQFTSLVSQNEQQVPSQRIKIYNKWVHLLTSGQKKWMSMNLNKIFYANMSFYIDKIQPTQKRGLSRIELSDYFYSQEEQNKFFKSTLHYEKEINNTLGILNLMPQLNYSLSLNDCLESYMTMVDCKRTLIAFENDLIGIAYSYCRRSCRFAGHLVNLTSKSKLKLLSDFMRSYGRENIRVFINGKQFTVRKASLQMLIPITSLNEKHNLQHLTHLQINDTFCDSRYQDQINDISLFCDDPEFYEIFGGNSASGNQQNYSMEYPNEPMNVYEEVINPNISQELPQIRQTALRNRSRSRNQDNEETQQLPRQNRRLISSQERSTSQWRKRGHHKGKQRFECLLCKVTTTNKEMHQCQG